VEDTEEDLLAATTARAVEAASHTPPGTQAPAHEIPTTGEEVVPTGPDGPPTNMFQANEGRWGSREVEITEVTLQNGSGEPSFVFHTGDSFAVRIKVQAHEPTDD